MPFDTADPRRCAVCGLRQLMVFDAGGQGRAWWIVRSPGEAVMSGGAGSTIKFASRIKAGALTTDTIRPGKRPRYMLDLSRRRAVYSALAEMFLWRRVCDREIR